MNGVKHEVVRQLSHVRKLLQALRKVIRNARDRCERATVVDSYQDATQVQSGILCSQVCRLHFIPSSSCIPNKLNPMAIWSVTLKLSLAFRQGGSQLTVCP